MKKTLFLFLGIIVSIASQAQAPVPTSWDCSGSLPSGYTESDLNASHFYTTSPYYVSPSSAYKMDRQDEWLTINVNDAPGAISFQLRGTGTAPWQGVLKVQESVSGSTWTDVRTYSNADVNANAWNLESITPTSTSRYLRFYYTTKVSGYNLGIDDISVALPSAGPAQEIAASYSGNNVANGGTIYFASPVGTAAPITISIQNLGTVNTLNISSATITGAASADYTLTTTPSSIAAASNSALNFSFNPSATGTRDAILTINNDDSDENPFIIHLKGIGGSYASEPTSNPSSISFTSIKPWKMTARWTPTTADGFILLRKAGSAVSDAPVDGIVYDKGMGIGSSKVFFVGSLDSAKIQEMIANTTYHYALFSYNGIGSYTNYKQSAPATGSQASSGLNIGTYYSTVDSNSSTFVTDLTAKINSHTQIFYSDYDNTIISNYFIRDTTGDQMVVTCDYSGENKIFTPPFDFTATNRAREHCFASSWMPTFGTVGHEDKPAYSDQFNLKFANQNDVNAPRSNHAFGLPTSGVSNYLAASWGNDIYGHEVFTPMTDFRGDIARSLFYMTTCYHNASNGGSIQSWAWNDRIVAASFGDTAWHLSAKLKQDVMKQWAIADPVSNEEIARAEYINSIQRNRNPFIDNPGWICRIDFTTMQKTASCNISVQDVNPSIQATVYPNPTSDYIIIELDEKLTENANISIQDIQGKTIFMVTTDASMSQIDTRKFAPGVYVLTIQSEGRSFRQKVVVQ